MVKRTITATGFKDEYKCSGCGYEIRAEVSTDDSTGATTACPYCGHENKIEKTYDDNGNELCVVCGGIAGDDLANCKGCQSWAKENGICPECGYDQGEGADEGCGTCRQRQAEQAADRDYDWWKDSQIEKTRRE